jgi:TRAP-type uncharacterized transport system substrate-binding protein
LTHKDRFGILAPEKSKFLIFRDMSGARLHIVAQNSTTAILNMVRKAANVSIKNYLRAVAETQTHAMDPRG